MDNLANQYKLSQYKNLINLNTSEKSEISLVQDLRCNKIYIKKVLSNYDKKVYEILKKLKNTNIPVIYDYFEMENRLIVIEEFINGNTLEETIEEKNILEEKKVIEHIISLCDILNEIHSLNPPIVHRDVKPSNIIITNEGVLKLIDFDVSRVYKINENRDTVILGTEGYAPPEQFGFTQTDCRSDIYSIGILMNVLTTGKHPREKENNGVLMDVIKKCTNLLADERYQNVRELKRDLEVKQSEIIKINIKKESSYENINSKDTKRIHNNIQKKKEIFGKEKIGLKNFNRMIPGFRTNKVWKKAVAIIWYLFLFIALFLYDEKNVSKSIYDNFVCVIMLLLIWLMYTNFLNVNRVLPIIKSGNLYKKIVGYILYTFVLIVVAGIVMQMGEK